MVVATGHQLQHSHDEGFSLTELIVVVALLAVIMGISYGGMQAVQASREVSDRQALFSNEVSTPLNTFEEVISQTLKVEQAGPYSMTVLTDADTDNLRERHVIQCTTGGELTHRRWSTNMSQVNVTLEYDALWSEHNINQSAARPMFEYYDDEGDQTTVADDAEVVVVRLWVEYQGREYTDSRRILMRNR